MTGRARIWALIGVAAFLAWLNLYHPAPNALVKESARSATLVATNQAGALLDVARYDEAGLAREFESSFLFARGLADVHRTPSGAEQRFTYIVLRRR